MTADELAALLEVDSGEWKAELPLIQEHFATFGDRLPQTLRDELDALEQRLESTPG
jgi:phosphoenolpyruvate carboxykinase (GTP)